MERINEKYLRFFLKEWVKYTNIPCWWNTLCLRTRVCEGLVSLLVVYYYTRPVVWILIKFVWCILWWTKAHIQVCLCTGRAFQITVEVVHLIFPKIQKVHELHAREKTIEVNGGRSSLCFCDLKDNQFCNLHYGSICKPNQDKIHLQHNIWFNVSLSKDKKMLIIFLPPYHIPCWNNNDDIPWEETLCNAVTPCMSDG